MGASRGKQVVTTMKPRHYKRSTPVGRLRRNSQKVVRHAGLVGGRIASWKSDNPRLAAVRQGAESVVKIASEMDEVLAVLEQEGFEPPAKPWTVEYSPGDRVAVADKYLSKYKEALSVLIKDDPEMLGDLVVDKVLPTGELVLRRGRRIVLPVVPKSHVESVDEGEDEE